MSGVLRWWRRRRRRPARLLTEEQARDLWAATGFAPDIPVVIAPGRLYAGPDGRGLIEGWAFDGRFMSKPLNVERLWDHLSSQYPVERVESFPPDRGGR